MPYSPERADYADPEPERSGMDKLADKLLRGSTALWALALIGSAVALWCIGIAAERGLLR